MNTPDKITLNIDWKAMFDEEHKMTIRLREEAQEAMDVAHNNYAQLAKARERIVELSAWLKKLCVLAESGMMVNHPQCSSERRDDHAAIYEQARAALEVK